jgi:putative FmdB family regulatory protein
MPIYEYIAETAGCEHCRQPFDVLQKLSDPDLATCPECGAAVHRRVSAPSLAIGGAHLLKESHAAKNGFTQYRRAGGGVYEKTAGKGPKYISGD